MLSTVGGVLAAASVVGLLVALVWTLINGTKGLLLNCNLPDNMSYFSITYECPFDPTRIYVSNWSDTEQSGITVDHCGKRQTTRNDILL